MDELIGNEFSKYYLHRSLILHGETWELWQGFREIGMLRYKTGSEVIDFHGEWLGNCVLKLHFEVSIPALVEIGGRGLEECEVDALAARMHLALRSMKQRNVVVRKTSWPPLPEPERDEILLEFQRWMQQRGWRVTVDRAGEKVSIKTKRFWLFRRKPSDTEILEQGAWVAKAWHALLYKEVDRTVIFVGEGAEQTSNWLAELSW